MNLALLVPRYSRMSLGERAALEGLLTQIKPRLAIEIGTAEGGSLRQIAAHSEEVHSFDVVPLADELVQLPNVHIHTGNSHDLLPQLLARFANEGRSVDFVLIDGDHLATGVERDILDVLSSDAVTHTVVILHDTLNPEVRTGIDSARIAEHEKVALYDPDVVLGYLPRREPFRLELWGGLGVIVVDLDYRKRFPVAVVDTRFHELFGILQPSVEVMVELERHGNALDALPGRRVEATLRAELVRARDEQARSAQRLQAIEGSRGWRFVLAVRALREVFGKRP